MLTRRSFQGRALRTTLVGGISTADAPQPAAASDDAAPQGFDSRPRVGVPGPREIGVDVISALGLPKQLGLPVVVDVSEDNTWTTRGLCSRDRVGLQRRKMKRNGNESNEREQSNKNGVE